MLLKKICSLIFVVAALGLVEYGVFAADETNTTRDFTFGLSDEFRSITPLSEDADGSENLERFYEVRSDYPDEIPLFEPFDAQDYKHKIFVSPNGQDYNPGTIESPLKTIEAAIQKTATIKDKSGGAVIYLREGIYRTEKGITIPDVLAGTAETPTIISGYNDEKAVISGGISIKGSDLKIADDEVAMRKLPEKVRGLVYSADLTKLGYSLGNLKGSYNWNLSVDGTAYDVARWPNSEEVRTAKYEGEGAVNGMIDIGTVKSPAFPHYKKQNFGADGFEFQIIDPRPFNWENTGNIWLKGRFDVDWFNRYYKIKSFNPDKKSIRTDGNTEYGAQYSANHTYYYLNVLEELDIPGEWMIDNATGMLYIYPMGDIENSTISFSSKLSNVITFERYSKHVVISDVSIESSSGYAVKLQGYQNVIQRCNISKTNYGISLYYGKNCGVISNNIVSDNYGRAIDIESHLTRNVMGGDEATLTPTRNFIQNNTVVGSIYTRGGVQNIISHNEVSNPDSMGIYVAEQVESIFEYNEVVGGPRTTIDGGLIYFEGVSFTIGNIVRYNYLHDGTDPIREAPFGIYLDNTTGRNYVYGNIVQECTIFMHGGSDNVICNNVVIDQLKKASIYNSENFWNNGMEATLNARLLDTLFYYSPQEEAGKYKYYSEEWMNRFPALYDSWKDLIKLRREYKDVGKSKKKLMESDEWDDFFGMKRTAYVNNVMYNSNDIFYSDYYTAESDAYYSGNVVYTVDDDVFVDYANKNYNIKADSMVYRDVPGFEPLPPQERMGVIIADNLITNYGDYIKMSPSIPTYIDESDFQLPYSVTFKWSKNPIATFYRITVAKDKDFTEIIKTAKTMQNYYILKEGLDFDSVYYWKVEAVSEGQRFKDNTSDIEVASFRTGNYDEVASQEVLNYDGYNAKIEEINTLLDKLSEDDGTDKGVAVYKQGTKDLIGSLIEKSKKRVEKLKLNQEIEEEINSIYIQTLITLQDNLIPYTRTLDKANTETFSAVGFDSVIQQDGAFKVKAKSDYGLGYDNRLISPNETVSFNANFGAMSQWTAFGIKQIKTEGALITSNKGYYVVVKKDFIELQKYPVESGGAVKVKLENNSQVIAPNTWHKIDTKCEFVENGLRIIVNVDGANIFDWVDENPHYEFGYFSIMDNTKATTDGILIK